MRRSTPSRVFAVLFAPWFALVVAEPVPMHDCPMHSVHGAAMPHMTGDAGKSAVGDASQDRPEAAGNHVSNTRGRDMPSPPRHHQCCCLGSCCAAAPMTPTRAQHAACVPVEFQRDLPPVTGTQVVAASAEHILPFANAPPVVED